MIYALVTTVLNFWQDKAVAMSETAGINERPVVGGITDTVRADLRKEGCQLGRSALPSFCHTMVNRPV